MTKHHEKDESVGADVLRRLKGFTETLEAMDDVKDLPKKLTVHTIRLNLEPKAYSAEDVKRVRGALRLSQPVFAQFIGVATKTVQDWEQGGHAPHGSACRLMDEIFTTRSGGWSV